MSEHSVASLQKLHFCVHNSIKNICCIDSRNKLDICNAKISADIENQRYLSTLTP